ncbi:hypothetical protein BX600DRAFT_536880 [Xylariales sp. PMI_506]|nr:hypothetical protein BX600DRAFT_536880 [Xylariales sp. PMI_506]
MKYFAFAAAAAGLASAQSLSDYLPACAVDCLNTAIGDASTCSTTDLVCVCSQQNYVNIYTSGEACVLKACGSDVSVDEVLPDAQNMCESIDASTSAAGTATVTKSAASTTTVVTTTAATTGGATTTTAATGSSTTTVATTTAASSSATAESSSGPAASSTSSGDANVGAHPGLGVVGGFVVAILAYVM